MALVAPPTLTVGAAPRVNLMPRAEVERRGRNVLLRRWIWGLVAALAVVVIAAGAAFWMLFTAQLRLASENLRTQALITQIAELQPVSEKLALEKDLTTFRTGAMATDLTWTTLVTSVQSALPVGVALTGFSLVPGGAPVGEDPAGEIGASGTLTLTSQTPAEIVTLVRSLRPIPGVVVVDGWEATTAEGGFTYLLRIVFDQSVYTGAYAEEATE